MKTELLHSYSSTSLSGLSRSTSQVSLAINGSYSTSEKELVDLPNGDTGGPTTCFKEWSKNTFRKKILYRKIPVLSWAPAYSVKKLIADVIAGMISFNIQGLLVIILQCAWYAWGMGLLIICLYCFYTIGLTVGLTILPQGLAYATLSGLPPQVNSK